MQGCGNETVVLTSELPAVSARNGSVIMLKRVKNLVLATISLNRSTRTPLYLQLYRELREAIETGDSIPRLDCNARLAYVTPSNQVSLDGNNEPIPTSRTLGMTLPVPG